MASDDVNAPAAASATNDEAASKRYTELSQQSSALFPVNPLDVVDDAVNAAEDYLADGLDALEKAVTLVAGEDQRLLAGQGVDAVYKRLVANLQNNLGQFEEYAVKHLFAAPRGLVLPAVGAPGAPTTPAWLAHAPPTNRNNNSGNSNGGDDDDDDEETTLDQQLAEARQSLLNAQYLATAMRAENQRIEADLNAYRQAIQEGSLFAPRPARDASADDALRDKLAQCHEASQQLADVLNAKNITTPDAAPPSAGSVSAERLQQFATAVDRA